MLDAAHDELFALTPHAVRVFARTASGNVAPLRSIAGPSTGIYYPYKLALDPVHDELWVVGSERLAAFPRGAGGDVAPLRTLDRNIMWPWVFEALAVDPVHDELIAATTTTIKVFARTASGPAATPLREIAGPATRLANPVAIALDPVRDEIVAIDYVNYATSSALLSFPRTASGNVAPARRLSGPGTTMLNPYGLVIDGGRDEVIVANSAGYPNYPSSSGNSITVFPRGATGDVPPVRLLRGNDTALGYPSDVDLLVTTSRCAAGYACASGGCMPAGATDCGNATYCASGAMCGSPLDDPSYCSGSTFCAGTSAGPLVACFSPAVCAFGTSCPAGALCASGGCMPADANDCGAGLHCPHNHVCTADLAGCVPAGGTDCLNGRYCGEGLLCNAGGLWCQPPGVVDCGDGWFCASGRVCTPAGAGFTCDPPSTGGGGGAFCYSTSACIPSVTVDTCSCSGSTTPGQCVSGHPACSAVGAACGDGTHACCVGETCINGRCVAGCGQCAGKGCRP